MHLGKRCAEIGGVRPRPRRLSIRLRSGRLLYGGTPLLRFCPQLARCLLCPVCLLGEGDFAHCLACAKRVLVCLLPRRPSFRPRSGRRLDLGLAGTLSIGCLLRLERAQLCLPSNVVPLGLA